MPSATRGWTVVDEAGDPVEGLVVAAAEGSVLARADAAGRLRLPTEAAPAQVLDPLGLRPLAHRAEGDRLVVDRRDALAWTVGGEAPLAGNDVELFADAQMFRPILDAIRGARETLHLSQLLLFHDFVPWADGMEEAGRTMLDHLFAAADRGVEVRVLLNQNLLVPDSVRAIQAMCGQRRCIEVRAFPMSPNVLHAKVIVVDGTEAFIVGPPFQQKYWDTTAHLADEPRRRDPRPLHDVSLRVRGPAVAGIDTLFASLWSMRGDAVSPCPPPPPAGTQSLQLATTLPRGLLPEPRWHPRAAREAYQRAFVNAQDFVYLESQYFTSPSITQAIAAALHAKPDLQVILLLNTAVDVPLYLTWQKRRLASLGHPRHPRLGVFYLASPTVDPRRPRDVYIHAKLALVDDAWASVGTANLDSLSLEKGEEWGVPVEANVDVNALLLDGIEGAPRTGIVSRIRRRLWGEHLGDEGVWTTARPEGGWLSLWRAAAEANAKALEAGAYPARGRVLPYLPPDLPDVPPETPPLARVVA
jgi:phosphatidylserine/phosphatidylglycerophosphate/cardiolipin synthase-like enzyme